jgi:hypothetical protein
MTDFFTSERRLHMAVQDAMQEAVHQSFKQTPAQRVIVRYREHLLSEIEMWRRIKRPTAEGKACMRDAIAALDLFDQIVISEDA